MEIISVIFSTTIAFVIMILLLATKSKVASRISSGLIALTAISDHCGCASIRVELSDK